MNNEPLNPGYCASADFPTLRSASVAKPCHRGKKKETKKSEGRGANRANRGKEVVPLSSSQGSASVVPSLPPFPLPKRQQRPLKPR